MDSWSTLQALEAARQHLGDGRPLTAIAEDLGISRFRAGRLVQAARENGWVQLVIEAPPGIDPELSAQLAAACRPFGVRRVIVVPDADGRPALERAAADAVEDSARAGGVVGFACGRTANRVVSAVRRLPACEVVQLTGLTAPGDVEDSSVETVRRAARLTGREVRPVYEPMVQPSAAVAAERRRHQSLERAFATWDRLDTALITIGSWETGESNVFDSPVLGDALRHRATRDGARAEFCGHLVDAEGQGVAPDVTATCLTVPYTALASATEVVAVVARPQRVPAVRAALRTGIITTLVVIASAARELLEPTAA
ncbi:MAG: sugar-binding transcriptional regulator [Dermabacteraceae bacterium]